MSKKRWLAMLFFYIIYLLIGALVFQALEAPFSIAEKLEHETAVQHLQRQAVETLIQLPDGTAQDQVLRMLHAVQDLYGSILPADFNISSNYPHEIISLLSNETVTEDSITRDWNLWNAFFFSFITITTIGYGHLSPRTTLGQQFCIVYSLFGIPLNTLVFVTLADFYSAHVLTEEDRQGGNGRSTSQVVNRAMVYMMPGLLLFLIVPALIVMEVEGWTFLQSFYFAFISLTTIGFGDFVAGKPGYSGTWDYVYKGYIMLWTMFGLSYIIMIITFLIDALKSNPVRKMEARTAQILQKRTARLQSLMQSFLVQHQEVQTKSKPKKKIESGKPKPVKGKKGVDNPGYTISEDKEDEEQKTGNFDSVIRDADKIGPRRTRRISAPSLADVRNAVSGEMKSPYRERRSSVISLPNRRKSIMNTVAKILPERPQSAAGMERRPSLFHNTMSKFWPRVSVERHASHDCHHSSSYYHNECCKELQTLELLVEKVEKLLEMTKENWRDEDDDTNQDDDDTNQDDDDTNQDDDDDDTNQDNESEETMDDGTRDGYDDSGGNSKKISPSASTSDAVTIAMESDSRETSVASAERNSRFERSVEIESSIKL